MHIGKYINAGIYMSNSAAVPDSVKQVPIKERPPVLVLKSTVRTIKKTENPAT